MSEIFLSYARDDEAVARHVAKALEAMGYEVWWDAYLPAHRAYSQEIERRLEEADAIVVLWSKKAAESQWVRAEADFARTRGKLVQAQLDDGLPPLPFNQIQTASLKGWRGSARHSGWEKLSTSVAALISGEERSNKTADGSSSWKSARTRWLAAVGVLILAVAAFVGMRIVIDGDTARPRVAVLPFKSLDQRDASLVAGIWEDTRQAMSRNPQLLVLGPNTAEEIANKGSDAAAKVADYLVEANVRSVGNRVRVSANLVRTKDGAEVWSKSFDRQLDDVFALQSEIAGEIEGHIRGRLAARGGVQPENIATSGEVYALYSDARAKIRNRQIDKYAEAHQQLEQVVRMDPNFAPGWATLAVAKAFGVDSSTSTGDGEADARRAIALAPNLAAGHAALGFILGQSPAAQAALRRAVALDANDIEAVHWLANSLDNRQLDEKLELYSKVVEIEPLWWPAILNKLNVLLDTGNWDAAEQELKRLKGLEASEKVVALASVTVFSRSGDLSSAVNAGLALLNSRPDVDADLVRFPVSAALMQLGREDEARAVAPPPPFGPVLWRNDPKGLEMVEKLNLSPRAFFTMGPLPMNAGRVYLLTGRGAKLAELYRSAASSPEKMLRLARSDFNYLELAPFIALGLRAAGDSAEADKILATAESAAARLNPQRRPAIRALLGRVYAVQGRKDEAFRELNSAISGGWLPGLPALKSDLVHDPALASLRSDPAFEKLRRRVLVHLEKERTELGPVTIKYPMGARLS